MPGMGKITIAVTRLIRGTVANIERGPGEMDAVEPPKVPIALQPVFDKITAITSRFCTEHLDEEYAQLCIKLAAKLARKRPSPLLRGDRRI
jgi:Domain of unknown function (DUF6398)